MKRPLRLAALGLTLPFILANDGCESWQEWFNLANSIRTSACGSEVLSPYVGAAISAVPSSLVSGSLVRVIRPGDAYTQDMISNRLNVFLDDSDKIEELSCG